MNIHDTEHTGGHEIDPNLVEIADMLRIQDEMHEVTEQAENRMRNLLSHRRRSMRAGSKGEQTRRKLPEKPK